MTSDISVRILAPSLAIVEGQITTTSQQVAEHFGKRHAHVLRAIRNLECSAEYRERNFGLTFTEVPGPKGAVRQEPSYRITRDGFTFLAMGFTGKEAARWKEAYINAFNAMEAQLSQGTSATISPAQAQHLRELVQLVVESGKQGYGETWNRLHRKMQVNSYLELRPAQFAAAVEYLRGKMDGESLQAIATKHFPQLAAPAEPISTALLARMIEGGIVSREALNELAYVVNAKLFTNAVSDQGKEYGQRVARELAAQSSADIHEITVAATRELFRRTKAPTSVPGTPHAKALRVAHEALNLTSPGVAQ